MERGDSPPFQTKDAYTKLLELQDARFRVEKREFLPPTQAALFGLMIRLRDREPKGLELSKLQAKERLQQQLKLKK
jgi:hypothetical protein